jgi:hypothetical protein
LTDVSQIRRAVAVLAFGLACTALLTACRSDGGGSLFSASPPSPPHPRQKPEGFYLDPKGLVGLDETEMRARMGEPTTVREEPPAVVWRYASGICRMDLYFYHSVKTNKQHALTYVVGTTRAVGDAGAYCLKGGGKKGKTS